VIICPHCGDGQREGTGVCATCKFRFEPGTDDVTEPRRAMKSHGSMKRVYALLTAGILVASLFFLTGRGSTAAAPAQAGLEVFVTRIAKTIDVAGTIDPAMQQTLTTAARKSTGCGYVTVFLVPAAALGAPVPGQPKPETVLVTFIRTEYKPDAVAITTALDDELYVVGAGWSCS
jgi:hypothetical protein